jgi:urease accessory protein
MRYAERLPLGVLVAPDLGASSDAARDYVVRLWGVVRPALAGREAIAPRLWRS